MRIDEFSFGRITIDGVTYEHDVVIDHGKIGRFKGCAAFPWNEAGLRAGSSGPAAPARSS